MVAAAFSLSFARPARGEEPEAVRLEFEGAAGCPDGYAFSEQILGRTRRIRLVTSGLTERVLRIRLHVLDSGYLGELELTNPTGEPARRSFEDGSCDEVLEALGLVSALALDPLASLQSSADQSQGDDEPRDVPELSAASGGTPNAPISSESVQRSDEQAPAEVALIGGYRAPQRIRWRGGAGFGAVLLWGPAPKPLVALAPFFEIEPERFGSMLVFRFRFTPLLAQTGVLGPAEDLAVFRLVALRTELCPFGLRGRAMEVGVCARADAGALTVEGQHLSDWQRSTRTWAALGGGFDLGWSSSVFVRVAGGLAIPLVRDRFMVLPSRGIVHQPSWVGGSVALMAGLRFP